MPRKPSLPPLRPERNGRDVIANPNMRYWEPEDSAYSPDRFYTKATDEKGHGETVKVKLPPEAMAEMQRIIHSGKIPEYESPQDILRDALVHRIRWLNENNIIQETDLASLLRLRSSLARFVQLQHARAEIIRLVEQAAQAEHASNEEELVSIIADAVSGISREEKEALFEEMRKAKRSFKPHIWQRLKRVFDAEQGEEEA